MYINFNCHECGASFKVSEISLYERKSLQCSNCQKKVDKKFVDQLFAFCVEKNSQAFDVTFSSSPTMDLPDIMNRAINLSATTLKQKIKNVEINSIEDFSTVLKSDNEMQAIFSLIESALYTYHHQLRENFEMIGIDIGEMP